MDKQHSIWIGERLREAREAQGLQCADISKELKIREIYLKALEEEAFEKLPGDTYVVGFIRAYANHLGLNASELVSRYKVAEHASDIDEIPYLPDNENRLRNVLLIIGIGVLIVLLLLLLWVVVRARDENGALSNISNVSEVAETIKIEGITALSPRAPDVSASASVRAQSAPPIVDGASLAIRALARTWMRVESADGRVLFSSIVEQGDGFDLDGAQNYILATRDAGALAFFVGDEQRQALGRTGERLTSLLINPQEILANGSNLAGEQ